MAGKGQWRWHTSCTSSTERRWPGPLLRLRMSSIVLSSHVDCWLSFMPSSMWTYRCLLSSRAWQMTSIDARRLPCCAVVFCDASCIFCIASASLLWRGQSSFVITRGWGGNVEQQGRRPSGHGRI